MSNKEDLKCQKAHLPATVIIEKLQMPFKRNQMEDLMEDCFFRFLNMVPQFFEMLQQDDNVLEPIKKGLDGKK